MKKIITLTFIISIICFVNCRDMNKNLKDLEESISEEEPIPVGKAILKGIIKLPKGVNDSEKRKAIVYIMGQEENKGQTDSYGNFSFLVDTEKSGLFLSKSNHKKLYSTDISEGKYNLIAISSSGQYGIKIDNIEISEGEKKNISSIQFSLTSTVTGKIILQGQTDYTGIDVYVPGTTFISKTDSSGIFIITNIPEGDYYFRAEKAGYHYSMLSDISVSSGDNITLTNQELLLSTGAQGQIVINGDDKYSTSLTVEVKITVTDNAVLMQISEDKSFLEATWELVQPTVQYIFSEGGEKTIFIKFADSNGLESAAYLDSIFIFTDPRIKLESPANDSTISKVRPSFIWTNLSIPDSKYHIQISENEKFENIIHENYDLFRSKYYMNNYHLENNKRYYWRVSAIDKDGTELMMSDTQSFTTKLEPPITFFPSGRINSYPFRLLWEKREESDTEAYIQIATDSSFENIIYENILHWLGPPFIIEEPPILEEPILNDNTDYFWRLGIAVMNEPIEGTWSDTKWFIIDKSVVDLNYPRGGIIPKKPTFDWNLPVSQDTGEELKNATFNLQIATDSNFENIIESISGISSNKDGIYRDIIYKNMNTIFSYGNTYYWRVAVIDENGIQGNWAGPQSFWIEL